MKIEAILTSDIHLQHRPPVARSAEPDWYEAMSRSFAQLQHLQREHNAPIIIAGDIFDKWHANRTPELINFAIDWFKSLGGVYAIPGQHDLPDHRYEAIGKSAYGTLIRAGAFADLGREQLALIRSMAVHPYPWGREIKRDDVKRHGDNRLNICVAHRFIWVPGCGYPGADEQLLVDNSVEEMMDFDACVFGDNHKGFKATTKGPTIFNCGTLMRRRIDEIDYRPQVGLLYEDGSIEPHLLDVSEDKFIEIDATTRDQLEEIDVDSFIDGLRDLGSDSLDFREFINRTMDRVGVDQQVRELILSATEE